MFNKTIEELKKIGAEITTREIKQQPSLWKEAYDKWENNIEGIEEFLTKVYEASNNKPIKVIFTGAGTSEYVGNSIVNYLQKNSNRDRYIFKSVATTDLVSAPSYYLYPEDCVLLVSFARSGNSPESVAAVDLANKLVKNIFHLTITCAKNGELAKSAQGKSNNYLMLMPELSNDQGFAMTGSFSCMMLTALLIFDESISKKAKKNYVDISADIANEIFENTEDVEKVINTNFERMVYLGSGSLSGLTREAQLKLLELTAGEVTTVFDSSMGFRHGPKSFVNNNTVVIGFINNDPYTRDYDLDVLEEVFDDNIATMVLSVGQRGERNFKGNRVEFKSEVLLPDAYLALPMIVFAQAISLFTSIRVKNLPDTPSASGTVNRVVKGVIIHPYNL